MTVAIYKKFQEDSMSCRFVGLTWMLVKVMERLVQLMC